MPFDVPITGDNILEENNKIFKLFIVPESIPYFFSRGNPSTASVIIMNDDGKQYQHNIQSCVIMYVSTCVNVSWI